MLILDAALDSFFDLGFNRTTTEKIARRARVSRGAMLHHFPQRTDLVQAAVVHLNSKRLELFEQSLSQLNEGSEYTLVEEGIDAFWEQLQSPYFAVDSELLSASRTDSELRATLAPAIREFTQAWREKSEQIFPDLAQSKQYGLATALTRFLLEGIAFNAQSMEATPSSMAAEELIGWLKSSLRELFDDVALSKAALRDPQR